MTPPGTPAASRSPLPIRRPRTGASLLQLPEVRARLADFALEPVGSIPAEMAAYLEQQFGFWEPVVKAAGVRLTR